VNYQFIFAGKAVFTVSNGDGKHYTYMVATVKDRFRDDGNVSFVSVLTGPDNTKDYSYIGMLDGTNFRATSKSVLPATSEPSRVFSWAVRQVYNQTPLPESYEITHAGRCGRCARLLTEPVSLETGIGPECRRIMGIGV
jgi:hypothetical protein